MLSLDSYRQQAWFRFLPVDLQKLFELTLVLYEQQLENSQSFNDYSFLVFTAGKAYEGFLKYYLLKFGLISQELYNSRRLRIGRVLNPDVKLSQRDEYWLYDDLVRVCTPSLAKQIWLAWLECRNKIFHYFPDKPTELSLTEAAARIEQITAAIEAAVSCQTKNTK